MENPDKAIMTPPLLQAYRDDIIRWVIDVFQEKNISVECLLEWEKKYPILFPWNPEYNTERLGYNRINQVYPLAIIMASDIEHIQWALKKAQKLNIPFSLKNGGHDHTGVCLSDGFIINISRRDKIVIDCDHGYVDIGAGVTLGRLDLALAKNGCSWVPHGTCANVSAVGLSISAGIGALTRKYGLTIDHLVSAKLVLHDGKIITASEDENQDIFWLLRGAGATSIGIITDIRLKIYKSQDVVLFELKYKLDQLKEVLKLSDEFGPYTDNNLASKLFFLPEKNIDTDCHVIFKGQYEGTIDDLNKLLVNFIHIAKSVKIWAASAIDAAITYNKCSANPPWYFFYQTLFTVDKMNDTTLDALVNFTKNASAECSIVINALGGKMAEVPYDGTAFPWRDAKLWIHIMSESRDQRCFDTMKYDVNKVYNDLLDAGLRNEDTGVGRLYMNFKDLTLKKEQYCKAYWGPNYKTISEIKKKYDPKNVFKMLHGV